MLRALAHQPRYNDLEILPLRWTQMLWDFRTGWWGCPESISHVLCAQVSISTMCIHCLIPAVTGSASWNGAFSEQGGSRSDFLLEF